MPPSKAPLFPVHFASPSTPTFPSPISPQFPMHRVPSPLASAPPSRDPRPSRPVTIPHASPPQNPGSTSSLSTVASTSSRALKTPHSKIDHRAEQPAIASSSSHGSHDGHHLRGALTPTPTLPLKDRSRASGPTEPRSPTPTQRYLSSENRNQQDEPIRERLPPPPPPMTQRLLPPIPHQSQSKPEKKASRANGTTRAKHTPKPLDIAKKEDRLSQDWVQILGPAQTTHYPHQKQDRLRARSTSPLLPEATKSPPVKQSERSRLPDATMVPMKNGSGGMSPRRPTYERSNTAPTTTPPSVPPMQRAARQGRSSLDALRSSSPSQRPLQNPLSTPPPAVLDYSSPQSTAGRLNLFRNGSVRTPPSEFRGRASEDILRPSMDSLRARSLSKKDAKVLAKEQQRALGVAGGFNMATPSPPPTDTERKSSGLSLKKSSGALKALFNRGMNGKGKERAETPPPVPIADDRFGSMIRASWESPRPSFGFTRPKTPGSSSPLIPSDGRSTPLDNGLSRSLGTEKTIQSSLPLQRTMSQGSHPVMSLPNRPRVALPSRDLPPLPPPSPAPPTSSRGKSQTPIPPAGPKQLAVERTSSPGTRVTPTRASVDEKPLPYLDPTRLTFAGDINRSVASTASTTGSSSPASFSTAQQTESPATSSESTSRPSPSSATPTPSNHESPLKGSPSLHLLQLPELDLNFDFAFDNIGASPSTPRKVSPQKQKLSPSSPTPQRSLTNRVSPKVSPMVSRVNSGRRRSKSFDGHGPGRRPFFLGDVWNEVSTAPSFASPSMIKILTSSSSASVPAMSQPLEPASSTESGESSTASQNDQQVRHAHTQSFSSELSALSSGHARTLSITSSTNETSSPSAPHTPEDERSAASLGFGAVESPSAPTPTPSAPSEKTQIVSVTKPFALNEPPSIPLPALPPTAVLLAPPAIIEVVKPAPVEKKKARENKQTLTSRSKVVVPDPKMDTIALAREMEQILYE